MIGVHTIAALPNEPISNVVGSNRGGTGNRLLEVRVDRRSGGRLQTLQLAGGCNVVSLDYNVKYHNRYECDEKPGCLYGDQCERNAERETIRLLV